MNEANSRLCVTLSLILSLISCILCLIAFYLPNWKYIHLRSTFVPTFASEDNHMDPLIRGEVEKYTDILYRPGDIHTFGLLTHCIGGGNCGQNLLLSYNDADYGHCHNIKFHQQCIFSNSLLSSSKRCTCEKPFYISTTYTLLIFIIVLEILFLIANFLRLYRRRRRRRYCLNELQLRIIAIITRLFSFIFLLTIIIQQNQNRLTEPLKFFRSMHHHYYSRLQIYIFSKNLEIILKQIEEDLDVRFGACYICLIFILILTFISFLTSSTVEIKISSTFDEEENVRIHPPQIKHFAPAEEMRFIRQTKV